MKSSNTFGVRALSFAAGLVAMAGLHTSHAMASDWIEPRANDMDAGEFVATAQIPIGFGELESITGRLDGFNPGFGPGADPDGQDMFLINITVPTIFTATTIAFGFEDIDTQLFLFNVNGFGLLTNDQINTSTLFSRLVPTASDGTFMLTMPGQYVIGVAGQGIVPVSSGGALFSAATPTEVSGPDGPGGALMHEAWTGRPVEGRYRILLTGVEYVPGPSGLVAMSAGLVVLARRRRS